MHIAIIGTGISGLMAAHVLRRYHDVELFEKEKWVGGHAHTVDADTSIGTIPVDTGFIVYNEKNYPLFTRLMHELGVETIPSDMSFGMFCPADNFAYSSRGIQGLLASPSNLLKPKLYAMARDIVRFNRLAATALESHAAHGMTLGKFLEMGSFSQAFIRYYIEPMSSAIWSASQGVTLNFPAEVFFRFFQNHGLLSIAPDVPWRTVKGGSRAYVQALTAPLKNKIHTKRPVRSVRRERDRVRLSFDEGADVFYDHVVMAAHADQSLRMLADPSDQERQLLDYYPYQSNRVVLHNDTGVLPPQQNAWASWNVQAPGATEARTQLVMTYHMNRLQNLDNRAPLMVTLNPSAEWRSGLNQNNAGKTFYYETDYEHPRYLPDSFSVQPGLSALNGVNRTSFCGAYFGYGFHEDGLRSGLQAAEMLGATWKP
jgi:uncharacterized protein